MNWHPPFLRPARSGPRHSVRPFYVSLLIITTLTVASWTLAGHRNGQAHERTAAGVLLRRADEPGPEVSPLSHRGMVNVANHAFV